MKLKIRYAVLTGLILMAFSGCKNYLDVVPKGELLAEKLKDYDLMFNTTTMTDLVPTILEYATDDFYSALGTEATSTTANAYFWRDNLDEETESAPVIWLNSFKTQYYCNY